MKIEKKQLEGETFFMIAGKIDANTSRKLEDTLTEHINNETDAICIDFSDVSYISSAGLRVLILTKKRADNAKMHIRLTGVSSHIRDTFKMTGFLGLIAID